MKVKFLTVIWGARYIEEFARISLPSYLAPGNLPYVASATELEILILTSAEGRAHFDSLPIMEKLPSLCPVRFILIDDLIATGIYGVTLTLAYARGILDSGAEQTNTHFLFMNSDFVLADGSLRTTIEKLGEGCPCIMAPSLRAVAEPTLPILSQALSPDGHVLIMPPRAMVRLALDNLHLTVVAKTITQSVMTCASHTQIYWQVDDNTLLTRHHLIFMLAIKPEVPLGPLNSYSDYGFVPELVPSGKFAVIDDSDGFFMLELQSAASERHLIKGGTTTVGAIAAELSQWTTPEHRRCADYDVVFRTAEPGAGLEQARAQARELMTELRSKMTNPPISHVNHHYWVAGVQAWASLKYAGESPVLPPELRGTEVRWSNSPFSLEGGLDIKQRYLGLLGAIRRRIGTMPDVPVWHYLWLDSRLLLNWIAKVKAAPASRALLVCGSTSQLAASLPKHLTIDITSDSLLLATVDRNGPSKEAAAEGGRYQHMLIHLMREDLSTLPSLLRAAEQRVAPDGTISVFIEHRNADLEGGNMSSEFSRYADLILPPHWIGYDCSARYAGGVVKRGLRVAERSLYPFLRPLSLRRLPLIIIAGIGWVLIGGLTALNNLRERGGSRAFPDHCSGMLLSLSRRNLGPNR